MIRTDLIYELALRHLNGIGLSQTNRLLSHVNSAEELFKTPFKHWPFERKHAVSKFSESEKELFLGLAQDELEVCQKNNWDCIGIGDERFPARLKICSDPPLVLFTSGPEEMNPNRAISIVGTRNATKHGIDFVNKFVEDLIPFNCTVISGLALGIDACAHANSLKHNIPTLAVLGNSLDKVYPAANRKLYKDIAESGKLISEFPYDVKPDRQNFPQRNRIVAGMCDATIVVEAAEKGGALITAELAHSYHRDVFAVPGRSADPYSKGCNLLIKAHKAALIDTAEDLSYVMGWTKKASAKAQVKLNLDLPDDELDIIRCLQENASLSMDELAYKLAVQIPQLLMLSTNLEIKGLVRSLPGNRIALK